MPTSSTPELLDTRSFSLIDYRHSHAHAVLRGFPPFDDITVERGEGVVLDLRFVGLQRISCWKDIGTLHLRIADAGERSSLERRIGTFRRHQAYLLEPDSIESYVIAGAVHWAEFLLPTPFTHPSPLDPSNRAEVELYRPIGGVVHSSASAQ
ncbi:hypothetical protein [Kitasatospora paranensis]|uniref:Uncharacterized protein n=1 Tax=Kitasatospora paranensis TaxID=258053 RepID=A0ABW2G3M1_9ACTN